MSVRRRVALLTAGATVLTVLAGVPALAAASPRTGVRLGRSSVHWHRCHSFDLRSIGAQCASVRVPLDYARPSGATISLALARVRHSVPAARFQGVMLTNPGGPGASGRYLAGLGEYVPHGAGRAYDWIGIDPRGVGASRPALSCQKNYFGYDRPNYDPSKTADRRAWLARSRAYAAACGRRNGALLQHMTTRDSARDLDRIRIALGARKINYYGYSYGTYLGQVYATLYPSHVRRMALDSNVNPTRVWYRANLDQDRAFQHNVTQWFGWLAAYDTTYHLGTTAAAVAARWYGIRNRLAGHADHGIGPDEWTDIFLDAAYYQSSWLELGSLFAHYVRTGSAGPLRRAYADAVSLGNDNEFAVYNAVQCTDTRWPTSLHKWRSDNARVNRTAPFETWANAWYNAACRYWPAKAQRPVHVTGRKVPSVLLIDETEDAATPYRGSLEVRTLFPRSRLIALPGGTSHADSLDGNACLDGKIAAYLARGALPARVPGSHADATCAPLPRPRP